MPSSTGFTLSLRRLLLALLGLWSLHTASQYQQGAQGRATLADLERAVSSNESVTP